MNSRFRKKRYALLVLLIGLYGAFFSYVVFGVERDKSPYSTGSGPSVDGQAKDITCDRNWFVLGAGWRCRATVVTPDGKGYPYSSFSNALSPADREVPMTALKIRGKKTTSFQPAHLPAQSTLGMLFGFFGSAVLAIGGPIALWPRRRK